MELKIAEYLVKFPVEDYDNSPETSELQSMVRIKNTEIEEQIEVPFYILASILSACASSRI